MLDNSKSPKKWRDIVISDYPLHKSDQIVLIVRTARDENGHLNGQDNAINDTMSQMNL